MLSRIIVFLSIYVAMSTTAQAALRLEEWKTYGAMAEQGGLCAAFARIMELQSIIDTQAGKLWLERRKFSGAVVRQASVLEGLPSASTEDIDDLVNRYSQWLLTNLASGDDAQSLDPAAHSSASKMISDVCIGLYDRADTAIFEKNPGLKACGAPAAPADSNRCDVPVKSTKEEQEKIKLLLRNNMTLSKELNILRDKIAQLEAAASTASTIGGPALTDEVASTTKTATTDAPATEREVSINMPVPKPEPLANNTTQANTTSSNTKIADPKIATITESKTAPTASSESPRFVAQLGSYRSESGADKGIVMLYRQFPTILESTKLRIATVKLIDGDPLYRIVTNKLARTAATDICNAMWNKKFGCLLKAVK